MTCLGTEEKFDLSALVEWMLVASEEPLDVGDEQVGDGLQQCRLHLLVLDNEERDALAMEIEQGELAGTAERLKRLTAQIKEIEGASKLVEVIHDETGDLACGWIRKIDA